MGLRNFSEAGRAEFGYRASPATREPEISHACCVDVGSSSGNQGTCEDLRFPALDLQQNEKQGFYHVLSSSWGLMNMKTIATAELPGPSKIEFPL